jgi:uncharacterized protein
MKNFIKNLLSANLPANYFYHNPDHTVYVLEKAMEIGIHEGCTKEDLNLLSIAALWHDTGYTKLYSKHEEESCNLARHHLPAYHFTESEIEIICGIIMATRIPQRPKTKLEEILADADLEYLGTESFDDKSDCLFRELQSMNASLTETKWNQMQISFLQEHHYFTRFCIENREPVKQIHLKKLLLSTQ